MVVMEMTAAEQQVYMPYHVTSRATRPIDSKLAKRHPQKDLEHRRCALLRHKVQSQTQ